MTGFGRTGAAFAASRLGVLPDLMTFAKAELDEGFEALDKALEAMHRTL